MQDRYAGDIGDYGKFALLRAIQAQGLSVAVNWYRVEPLNIEKKADGSYKQEDGRYLIPDDLYVCDRPLAEKLTKIAKSGKSGKRSIKALEKAALVPRAKYFSEVVPIEGRAKWHERALKKLDGFDVVFVDPDNGLLVDSVGLKSQRSVKYTFYEEVRNYINRGQSVLIYNHRCRKPEGKYFHDICSKLQKTTGISESKILKITFPKCSIRDYIAVPVDGHYDKLLAVFNAMEQSVWGVKGACRIPKPEKTTIDQIEDVRDFVEKQRWVFARTYAKKAPHEYIVRHKHIGNDDEFMGVVDFILNNGITMYFWNHPNKYIFLDGRQYWVMRDSEDDRTTIINRCDLDEYKMSITWKGAE